MQLFQSIFLLRDAIEGKWAARREKRSKVGGLAWIVKNKNFDRPKRNLSFLPNSLNFNSSQNNNDQCSSTNPKKKKKKKIQIPPLSQI